MKEQKNRLDIYQDMRYIRNGDHETAFSRDIQKSKQSGELGIFSTINIAKEICRVSADLIYQEPPKIKSIDDQKFVDNAISELKLFPLFYELTDWGTALGDSVFRIRVDNNEMFIEAIDPARYDVIEGAGKYPAREIIYTPKILKIQDKDVNCTITETYEYIGDQLIITATLKVDNEERYLDVSSVGLLPEVRYNLSQDERLIFHVKNAGDPFSRWGESDIVSVRDLIFAIDSRYSRMSRILDIHSNPKVQMPKSMIESVKQTVALGLPQDYLFIDKEEAGIDVKYIAWDARLENARQQLEDTIDMILTICNVSPSLVGRGKEGVAESGRALMYRILRSLAMKQRKEMYWTIAIQQLFWTLMRLSYQEGYTISKMKMENNPKERVSVEWQDGILSDMLEKIELIERELASGLISKEDAIQKYYAIDEVVAQDRMEKIKKENEKKSLFFAPSDGQEDNEDTEDTQEDTEN